MPTKNTEWHPNLRVIASRAKGLKGCRLENEINLFIW
jgi:hypothetical protein